MTIDSRLQAAYFPLVPYNQRLPEPYAYSPVNRTTNVTPCPQHTLMDSQDCYDSGNSFRYTQDLRTGSVKAVSMMSLSRKGELVDIMV